MPKPDCSCKGIEPGAEDNEMRQNTMEKYAAFVWLEGVRSSGLLTLE